MNDVCVCCKMEGLVQMIDVNEDGECNQNKDTGGGLSGIIKQNILTVPGARSMLKYPPMF